MDDQLVDAMPARHFTVQSLAAYWGVSPSHIYNLIHSNALRHMRIGKAIRIPTIFIKEYEEQSCQELKNYTDSGSTTTVPSISSGMNASNCHQGANTLRQGAFQRGQQIGNKPNNSGHSS